jgi:hypothetical protein
MRFTALLAGILAVGLFGSAAAQDKDKGKEKISIRGMAASVSPADDEAKKAGVLGTLLMEGKKDKDTEYDKAFVKVTKATKIFMMVGGELKAAKFEDLKPGVKTEIQFIGSVGESFPVQATAGKIVIYPR